LIRKRLLKQPLFQIVVVFKWCYFSNTSLTSHFLKTFVKLCYNYIIPLVGEVWSVLMCWYQKYFFKNKNILFWCVSEKKITLKSNCFYAFKHPFSVLFGGGGGFWLLSVCGLLSHLYQTHSLSWLPSYILNKSMLRIDL